MKTIKFKRRSLIIRGSELAHGGDHPASPQRETSAPLSIEIRTAQLPQGHRASLAGRPYHRGSRGIDNL
eukprot:6212820-Pleurochrysis_carterae.AAC.6